MWYRLLADAVLVVHLAFIVFVVLGGLLVLRWPRIAWLHLPAVAWGAWIEFAGRICPLTPLEIGLREHGGGEAYRGGFIEHYVTALIYPDGLNRRQQVVLGAFVLVLNAAIYVWLIARRRSRQDS
jgi:Protein of Unknown function (DUF2784)